MNFATIGILGGMGPEATNKLCALITANTPVTRDQDHIPVITFNNPRIPDRVKAMSGGQSPLPEMVRTARVLEDAGADMLLMPCNLAHYYIEELRAAVRVPMLDMVEEAVRFAVESYPLLRTAGLLASTPTLRCGIYERRFSPYGWRVIAPRDDWQESRVMEAIYGERGIKRGHKTRPSALLKAAARDLAANGAEVIIAGCTEVSLVLTPKNSPHIVIDPLEILARRAVEKATGGAACAQAAEPALA
jgi:aspartate racemase